MSNKMLKPRIILVDDEEKWLSQLCDIISHYVSCEIVSFGDYESADRYITSNDMSTFSAAVIDVRLRKQIYDQGGLTLLNLIKERNDTMPVLVLTAYSYDYPGLRQITKRYPAVFAYDKEVFEKQPAPILDALLAELPPQIGDGDVEKKGASVPSATIDDPPPLKQTGVAFGEIVAGALVVGFVLVAALLFFLLSSKFTEFSWHLNIVFAVLMVALIGVLIRVFKPAIITQAVSVYKELLNSRRADGANEPAAVQPEDKEVAQENAQQSGRGDAEDRTPHP